MLRLRQFEVSAFRFEREGVDSAVGAAAAKVHQKEMVLETVGQPGAGKVSHAGRTARDVGDGRDNVGRLAVKLRIPKFLRVERSARVRSLHELITDAPAIVAALHHVNPAGLVAAVRIVVAGKQIAVLIENEVLRIAQAEREHFEIGAVRIAAEDAAGIGLTDVPAIRDLHVRAPVTDAEIDFPIRTEMRAVEVMADETDAHAEAVVERLAEIGDAIAVGVAQEPEVRNVRIPDVAFAREHAGANAIERRVETVGEDGRVVCLAVAVPVFEQTDAFAVFGVFGKAIAQMPFHLGQPVVHAA